MTQQAMPEEFHVDPPKPPSRGTAIALALAAAALLLGATFTRKWLVNDASRGQDLGIGLHSMYLCSDGGGFGASGGESECVEKSTAEFVQMVKDMSRYSRASDQPSSAFVPAGWVTFGLLLIAGLSLIGGAALAHFRRPSPIPMAPTSLALLALMLALITGCVFVATKPGPAGAAGVGLSFWLFGVGAVVGIAGAQMLAKLQRMTAPDA